MTIQETHGNDLTARIYADANKRDLARKVLRRKYQEGTQMAFCYFENPVVIRAQLRRLREWLRDEREDETAVQRVHDLFMKKLAAEYPDHPWLRDK